MKNRGLKKLVGHMTRLHAFIIALLMIKKGWLLLGEIITDLLDLLILTPQHCPSVLTRVCWSHAALQCLFRSFGLKVFSCPQLTSHDSLTHLEDSLSAPACTHVLTSTRPLFDRESVNRFNVSVWYSAAERQSQTHFRCTVLLQRQTLPAQSPAWTRRNNLKAK